MDKFISYLNKENYIYQKVEDFRLWDSFYEGKTYVCPFNNCAKFVGDDIEVDMSYLTSGTSEEDRLCFRLVYALVLSEKYSYIILPNCNRDDLDDEYLDGVSILSIQEYIIKEIIE